MFNFTNKNAGNTTRWLILGALGVLLIINRRFALTIAYIVFAIGLMLAGAASAFGWWERSTSASSTLPRRTCTPWFTPGASVKTNAKTPLTGGC